jgi:glucosamine--fructose-6-phosphate aminotransferase (isomerizing)
MCGIVGYLGRQDGLGVAIDCLKRLEYRGYDSAGVAAVARGAVDVRRSVGKIANLEASLSHTPMAGRPVLAHTRWATHGRPSPENAHPHVDCRSRLALVHNGIIENHGTLRRALESDGHGFRSQTDTEVIAHLIERHYAGRLTDAVRNAASQLRGAFAIACITSDDPDIVVAARSGSTPLVIGFGDDEVILASDIAALLWRTRRVLVLEDHEMAVITPHGVTVERLDGGAVHRDIETVTWDVAAAERGGYPHFMLKETFEQPDVVEQTIIDRITAAGDDVRLPELLITDAELAALDRVSFVACGTSWHAALAGKYFIEALARVPVEVDVASEFRYRDQVIDSQTLAVAISQSGETADTLAALREAKRRHARAAAICNVVGSSLAREADDGVVYTRAGLEIGVASTKAFTTQLAAVLLLAVKIGLVRGTLSRERAAAVLAALRATPALLRRALEHAPEVRAVAERVAGSEHALYLGRGVHMPLALEGALKLKEVSYIHAAGYPAGEMKHGPIALIRPGLPVVAVATSSPTVEKVWANVEEIKARDGLAIAVADEEDAEADRRAEAVLRVPAADYWVQPIVAAVPLQLLAYYVGTLRGCDVDQPRNLAKSVTVE